MQPCTERYSETVRQLQPEAHELRAQGCKRGRCGLFILLGYLDSNQEQLTGSAPDTYPRVFGENARDSAVLMAMRLPAITGQRWPVCEFPVTNLVTSQFLLLANPGSGKPT